MPPSTAPAITEPQTANDETCLISPAFAGSCSAAPSSREMSAPPPTPNTPPTAMTRPSSGRAEGDRGEQRGVVQRADEAGVDEVVDGADDHRGGHRHAQVHEGADDRRGREVPAVGADGVGLVGDSRVVVLMTAPFRAGSSARRRTPARRGDVLDARRGRAVPVATGSAAAVPR